MEAGQFGKFIRTLRKKKKMTIRQLELYSGVSNAYLSQIENGKRGIPSPDILKKLWEPLGITYEELMEKAGHINPNQKGNEESVHIHPNLITIVEIIKTHNLDLSDPRTIQLFEKVAEIWGITRKEDN